MLQHHYDESGVTEASSELQAEGAEELHVQEPAPAQETIKVEISTPADFSDVYFEIATIKSPYTFQVSSWLENGVRVAHIESHDSMLDF